MARIHSCEFSNTGVILPRQSGSITAHQPGWLRRYPVRFSTRVAQCQSLVAHLNSFPRLQHTLGQLDYRHFSLQIIDGIWCCRIEPWAASEVICHLPPLRRYLRLTSHQRMLLLSVLNMVAEAIDVFNRFPLPSVSPTTQVPVPDLTGSTHPYGR